MIADVINHLWQSTVVVAIAAIVTMALHKNGGHVRHAIWMVASLKFLVPFALLTSLGGVVSGLVVTATAASDVSRAVTVARDVSSVVDRFAQPLTADVVDAVVPVSAVESRGLLTVALLTVWVAGAVALVARRIRGWLQVRTLVRASQPLALVSPYPVRSAPGLLEPGVVGIWRPVLLLPDGIERHLAPEQLRAVLEHEWCHIRRRDNLTSALHMLVEIVCWFHPAVWWVGAKLVDERERACDEHVLRVCGEPEVYAQGILNVCKRYVESPLLCVSGVSGSDLRKRVTAIMAGRVGVRMTVVRQAALGLAAVLSLAAPLLAGLVEHPQQSATRFDAVTIKPCADSDPKPVLGPTRPGFRNAAAPHAAMVTPGHVLWSCATLAQLIPQAYTDTERPLLNTTTTLQREDDYQPSYVKGGPSWARTDRFTIEAKAPADMTAAVLGNSPGRAVQVFSPAMSHALRQVLQDSFHVVVDRASSEVDLYAMSVGPGGLNSQLMAPPVPGDCQTIEQYAAATAANPDRPVAERIAAGNPRICGRSFSVMDDQGYFSEFTSVTLDVFARFISDRLGYVVVDRTGAKGLFNIKMREGTLGMADPEGFYLAQIQTLGLRVQKVRGQAEHLVIKSVQRLRQ